MRLKQFILLIVAVCAYGIGVYLSCRYYDVGGYSFIDTQTYTYNLPLSLLTTLGGIMAVVLFSQLVRKLPFVNWFGKNSLVVLCVHFPLMERLNYFCFYCFTDLHVTYMPYKLTLVLMSYVIVIAFSSIAIVVCKKYIPKLSGYDNLIPLTQK